MRRVHLVALCVLFLAFLALILWKPPYFMWPGKFTVRSGTNLGPDLPNGADPGLGDSVRTAVIDRLLASPFSLYGKVIDQYGNPVPDAEIKFYVLDTVVGNGSKFERKSDREGRFSISNIRGIQVGVAVSKEGYYQLKRIDGKVTSHGEFSGTSSSSKESPMVFHLQKQNSLEPLNESGAKSFYPGYDGEPTTVSLDSTGNHSLIFRYWSNEREQEKLGHRKYDWRMEILVNSGGLADRLDLLNFNAPRSAYRESESINMPANSKFWSSLEDRSFFFKFNDNLFARGNFVVHARSREFVAWESFLNPKVGSMNLDSGTGR